jgi:hypothetical protein
MATVDKVTRDGSYKLNLIFAYYDVSLYENGVLVDKRMAGSVVAAEKRIRDWVTFK